MCKKTVGPILTLCGVFLRKELPLSVAMIAPVLNF